MCQNFFHEKILNWEGDLKRIGLNGKILMQNFLWQHPSATGKLCLPLLQPYGL